MTVWMNYDLNISISHTLSIGSLIPKGTMYDPLMKLTGCLRNLFKLLNVYLKLDSSSNVEK